jgi:hypothetical protein
MKIALYILTAGSAFFFAFWERKIKRDLTNSASERPTAISDIGVLDDLAKEINRERFIANLPKATKRKLNAVIALKLAASGLLVLEVFLLQR